MVSLLTAAQLCEFLNVSRSSLWRLRQQGLPTLSVRGLVRFDRERVLSWLAEPAVSEPADPILPPGEYRCRRCGAAGALERPLPVSKMVCKCGAVNDVEKV
jgi:predicted DNA-binding transcriptional regulator AlpA